MMSLPQTFPISIVPLAHRTKTEALAESLTELAKRLGPGSKLPGVRSLATSFHVSTCTLDRVLADLERQNLIVRKHSRGVFVSDRVMQRTIGLVYGRNVFQVGASPFRAMLLEQARRRAASKDERFSFYLDIASDEDESPTHRDLMDDVRSKRLNGIIFASAQNPRSIEWLQQQRMPMVALSSSPVTAWRVAIDFAEVIRLGTQALANEGCRRIALIPALSEDQKSLCPGMVGAFEDALRKAGLEPMPGAIWNPFGSSSMGSPPVEETFEELGYRAVKEIFGKPPADGRGIPDGLVSADDIMTQGAVVAFRKLGLRMGRDVKVATHANRGSPVLQAHEQEMILVEVDPTEMVDALFQMLETLMEGATPPVPVVLIRPHLERRAEDQDPG